MPENPSPLKKRGREEEGKKEADEKGVREKEVGGKEASEEELGEKEVSEEEVGEKEARENEVREIEAGGERDTRRPQLRKKPSRICRTLYKFRRLFSTA